MKRAAAFLIGLLSCSLVLADFAIVNSPVDHAATANPLGLGSASLALPSWAVTSDGFLPMMAGRGLPSLNPAAYNTAEVRRLAQTPDTLLRAAVESDDDDPVPTRNHFKHRKSDSHAQVVIGQDYVLGAGEVTDGGVVVVRGHARIEGTVNGDVVLVGSDTNMSGTANGDFVSIASSVNFASGATVNGDFVSLLSTIQGERQATFNGDRTNLDLLSPHALSGLGNWLSGTVLFLRPMSPGSVISWILALGGLAFSLAVAGTFPKLLTETGLILRQRAPASFLSGVAIVPATALLSFLLTLTVVGILAVPLVLAALLVFALIGETAVFRLIGEIVAPRLGQKPHATYLWIIIGALICWILYCIPLLGFLAGSVVFLAGLGAFTIYVVDRSRRVSPAESEVPVQAAHLAKPAAAAPPAQAAGVSPALEGARVAGVPITPAAKLDREHSQFWPRLGSNLIDLVLLYAILESVHLTRLLIPAWVLYRFAMYVWRSTTLGGIVLNLQVQKLDGTTLTGDHSTALIRALSSLLSLLPVGLGFIWLLFDLERSTWHDKISGTRVVQIRQTPQSSVAPKPPEPPAPPE